MKNYSIAIENNGDQSYGDLVKSAITSARLLNNKTRSRAVSCLDAAVKLISGHMRFCNEQIREETGNPEAIRFSTMHVALAEMLTGKTVVSAEVFQRFTNAVCRAVGYKSIPTYKEQQDAFSLIIAEYISQNPYVKAELEGLAKDSEKESETVKTATV